MLIIDDREHGLYGALKRRCQTRSETACSGWYSRHGSGENDVNLAIERKTVSDLRASLRDGRFARLTCSRMVECYGTERCVYIIEGECESTELGVLMSLQFKGQDNGDQDRKYWRYRMRGRRSYPHWQKKRYRIGARCTTKPSQFKVPTTLSLRYLHSYRISQEYRWRWRGVSPDILMALETYARAYPGFDGISVTRDIKFGSRKVGPSIAKEDNGCFSPNETSIYKRLLIHTWTMKTIFVAEELWTNMTVASTL
jgi:hypothetical protein